MAYGICDGIPQYLLYLSHYGNLEEAVCEELLSPSGHLQEEPENLMLQGTAGTGRVQQHPLRLSPMVPAGSMKSLPQWGKIPTVWLFT